MNQQDDFKKYATKHLGISSMTLHQFSFPVQQLYITNHY